MDNKKYLLSYESSSQGIVIPRDIIVKSYMVLLFEERNGMRMIDDPQSIGFGDGTSIIVKREINTLSITFSDGVFFSVTEDEIRDFHYALTCLEANEVPLGSFMTVKIKEKKISIMEISKQKLLVKNSG